MLQCAVLISNCNLSTQKQLTGDVPTHMLYLPFARKPFMTAATFNLQCTLQRQQSPSPKGSRTKRHLNV